MRHISLVDSSKLYMAALVIVFLIASVSFNAIVIYNIIKRQNIMERALTNKQSHNHFYLSLNNQKKLEQDVRSNKQEQETEDDKSIVTIVDDTKNGDLYYKETKSVSAIDDSREKMVVQVCVREDISDTTYRMVNKTFILRKGMDVEEIISIIGEPKDIAYDDETLTRMVYDSVKDDEDVNLLLHKGMLYRIL